MPRFDTVAGVRVLSAITETNGSGRILNLHAVHHLREEELSLRARPMFLHPLLNRTIIAKHFPSENEMARLGPQRVNPTKVIFPFDPADLTLGGQFLFVDQPSFVHLLSLQLDYPAPEALQRDLVLLRLLDSLPTLDPFLVRQTLAKHGYDVSDAYFELARDDQARMLSFVEAEILTLIRLCVPGIAEGDARLKRMASTILSNESGPHLEPLRLTLRLAEDAFNEAMFTWKAFLYYRWRAGQIAPAVKQLQRSFSSIRSRYDRQELRLALARSRTLSRRAITLISQDIAALLRRYTLAYEALVAKGNPEVFRHFLLDGAEAYATLGDRIGRLEQMTSYWTWRFPPPGPAAAPTDALLDGFRDLLQAAPPSVLAKLGNVGETINVEAA